MTMIGGWLRRIRWASGPHWCYDAVQSEWRQPGRPCWSMEQLCQQNSCLSLFFKASFSFLLIIRILEYIWKLCLRFCSLGNPGQKLMVNFWNQITVSAGFRRDVDANALLKCYRQSTGKWVNNSILFRGILSEKYRTGGWLCMGCWDKGRSVCRLICCHLVCSCMGTGRYLEEWHGSGRRNERGGFVVHFTPYACCRLSFSQ